METGVTLDEESRERAELPTGVVDERHTLEELAQRGAARRIIELGGSAPDLVAPPRRRQNPEVTSVGI